MKISFLKTRQAKGFEFKPRYYNAEKEEFEARVKRIQIDLDREDNAEDAGYDREAVRSRISNEWKVQRSSSNKKSTFRRIMIAGILALLAYLLLYTDYFA